MIFFSLYSVVRSEKMIGALVAKYPQWRDRLFIVTKANPWHGNRLTAAGVRKQVELSLKNLNGTAHFCTVQLLQYAA